MTTYFRPTNEDDVKLLNRQLRQHQDLETVAGQAERDVIRHFTRYGGLSQAIDATTWPTGGGYSYGDGRIVCLRNFVPDADACTDADLVVALRDVIASVINWRLSKYGLNEAFTSIGTAIGVSQSNRADLADPFPPTMVWTGPLDAWDVRQPIYGI